MPNKDRHVLSIKPQNNRPQLIWIPMRSEYVDWDNIASVDVTVAKRDDTGLAVSAEAEADATDRELRYTFENSDLPESGVYDAHFEITYDDGTTQDSPNDGNLLIDVVEPPTDTEWGTYETLLDVNARNLTAVDAEFEQARMTNPPDGELGLTRMKEFSDLSDKIDDFEGVTEARSELSRFVYDDFRDYDTNTNATLSDRSEPMTGYVYNRYTGVETGRYRPEWSSGTSTLQNGHAHVGTYLETPSDLLTARWTASIDITTMQNSLYLYLQRPSGGTSDFWRVEFGRNTGLVLTKSDSGVVDNVADDPEYTFNQGDSFDVTVTRSPGGEWTVAVDGQTLIEHTDSFVPPISSPVFRAHCPGDTEIDLSYVTIEPFEAATGGGGTVGGSGSSELEYYIYDDFRYAVDGLSVRSNQRSGEVWVADDRWEIGRLRPTWDEEPTATDGNTAFLSNTNSNGRMWIEGTQLFTGAWSISGTIDTWASEFNVYPFRNDNGPNGAMQYWRIGMSPNYGIRIMRRIDDARGAETMAEEELPFEIGDGDEFTISFARSPSGFWYVFVNGEYICDVQDAWFPNPGAGTYQLEANVGGGMEVSIDELFAQPFAMGEPTNQMGRHIKPRRVDMASGSVKGEEIAPGVSMPHTQIHTPSLADGYHQPFSNTGARVVPKEPIHISKVDVNCGSWDSSVEVPSEGRLAFEVYDFEIGTGYDPTDPVARIDTIANPGRNTIDADLTLHPNDKDGYVIRIDPVSEFGVARDFPSEAVPIETDSVILPGGGAADGSTNGGYYYFMDIRIASDHALDQVIEEAGSGYNPGEGTGADNPDGILFADPVDGVPGIQSLFNQYGENTTVVLKDGEWDWRNSLELPNGATVQSMGQGNAQINIPDDHNLTQYPGPHGGTVYAAITNENHPDGSGTVEGNFDISVENLTINYAQNGPGSSTDYNIGVWLFGAHDSRGHRVQVNDVLPANPGREYGMVLTACEDTNLIECEGNNCGYEGLGMRGPNRNCRFIRCKTSNNGIHAAQIAGWTGGYFDADVSGQGNIRPKNCYVEGGSYGGNLITHGIHALDADPYDPQARDHHIVFDKVSADKIQIFESVQQVDIRDCHAQVHIVPRNPNATNRESLIEQINIDGLTYTGSRVSPIEIETTGEVGIINELNISRVHRQDLTSSDSLVTIRERASGGMADLTIGTFRIGETVLHADCPHLFTIQDTNYTVDKAILENNDLRNMSSILNPASFTGSAVSVVKSTGNDGLANYLEGIGGTDPSESI